jgi:hypothetical protein
MNDDFSYICSLLYFDNSWLTVKLTLENNFILDFQPPELSGVYNPKDLKWQH